MAVWQFNFSIIPRKNLTKNHTQLPMLIKNNFDDLLTWDTYRFSAQSLDNIALHLPATTSWSDEIKQFGRSDSTIIELWYEAGHLMEISVRLDLRNIPSVTINAILDMIRKNDALILSPESQRLFEPTRQNLTAEIQRSRAFAAVYEAHAFWQDQRRVQLWHTADPLVSAA